MYFLQGLGYSLISEKTGIRKSIIYQVVNDSKNNNENTLDWFKWSRFKPKFKQIF